MNKICISLIFVVYLFLYLVHWYARTFFIPCRETPSVYNFSPQTGTATAFLLLYVDDIILTASSAALLHDIATRLGASLAIKDLGPVHYFLGVQVTRSPQGFFLCQEKYAEELDRAGMSQCKAASTPIDTSAKLAADDSAPVSDPGEFRSLAGGLQYLTMTRTDLAHAVQQICLHMHDPRASHLQLLKLPSGMSVALLISVYICITPLHLAFTHTQTRIGPAALIQEDQL